MIQIINYVYTSITHWQNRVTSANDVNPQIVGILDMLTNTQQYQSTIG